MSAIVKGSLLIQLCLVLILLTKVWLLPVGTHDKQNAGRFGLLVVVNLVNLVFTIVLLWIKRNELSSFRRDLLWSLQLPVHSAMLYMLLYWIVSKMHRIY